MKIFVTLILLALINIILSSLLHYPVNKSIVYWILILYMYVLYGSCKYIYEMYNLYLCLLKRVQNKKDVLYKTYIFSIIKVIFINILIPIMVLLYYFNVLNDIYVVKLGLSINNFYYNIKLYFNLILFICFLFIYNVLYIIVNIEVIINNIKKYQY